MHLTQAFPPIPNDPEPATRGSEDVVVAATVQALLDAANTAKTTATADLQAACATAAREKYYAGGPSGATDATIRTLGDTITRLEGEILFYEKAVAGLA